MTIKVTIWNEGRHEQLHREVQEIYPDRIDGAIAAGIAHPDFEIRRGTLDDPDEGLPDSVLQMLTALMAFPVWTSMQTLDVDDEQRRRLVAGLLSCAIRSAARCSNC